MALSMMLGEAGLTAEKMEPAEVTLDKVGEGFEITASHLIVTARFPAPTGEVPGDRRQGQGRLPGVEAAEGRKITMDAKLLTGSGCAGVSWLALPIRPAPS